MISSQAHKIEYTVYMSEREPVFNGNAERELGAEAEIPLPDAVFDQFQKSNLIYPQMNLGILGGVWAAFLKDPSLFFEDLPNMILSDDQLQKTIQKMKVAHGAHGITRVILPERVSQLWLGFRTNLILVFSQFVVCYQDSKMQPHDNVVRSDVAKKCRSAFKAHIDILDEILKRDEIIQLAKKRNAALSNHLLIDGRALSRIILQKWQSECTQRLPNLPDMSTWFTYLNHHL